MALKVNDNIESEIRKDAHRNNFIRLVAQDVDDIICQNLDGLVKVNCPNCNKGDSPQEFEKGKFSFLRCRHCDTLYVSPRPNKQLLDQFIFNSKGVASTTKSLIENENGRRKQIFMPRVKRVLDFFKEQGIKEGRAVEVGCSIGTFLELLKSKSNFEVEGIDPSRVAYKETQRKGLSVHQVTLEDFKPSQKKFDVAFSFETIEHVFSPFYFLSQINLLLKKGGHLIFSTPNYHGFDVLVLGKYYRNTIAPCHLNYFNVDTIDMLLDRAGFKVIKKMTPGILDVCLVQKQVAEGLAPEIPLAIRHMLLDRTDKPMHDQFQKFLQENNLSSNMLIFAKKVREV